MSLAVLLLIVAMILFILSAIAVSSRINLQSAGLAFLTASLLAGGLGALG